MRLSQLASWLSILVGVAAQTAVPVATANFNPATQGGPAKLLIDTPTLSGNDFTVWPLTLKAFQRLPNTYMTQESINGTVALGTPGSPDTVVSPPTDAFAYISCDSQDYAGYTNMQDTISNALSHNVSSIVFYSITENTCSIEDVSGYQGYENLYTMTTPQDSEALLGYLDSSLYRDNLGRLFTNDAYQNFYLAHNPNDDGFPGSGSTAIAMIILYAITGIITILFLIIIVTGAVRAHRHPERYGPRNVLGISRQSRAKGLARAMLDTIPIVKFGERVPGTEVKDIEGQDVQQSHEMATSPNDGTTQGNVNGTDETATSSTTAAVPTSPATETPAKKKDTTTGGSTTNDNSAAAPLTLDTTQSGLAPAVAASATAINPHTPHTANLDENELQTCSICTDDFAIGQDIRLLPCNHAFHPTCVDPWLLDVSGTCPLCRVDLNPSGEGEDEGLPPPLDPEAAVDGTRRIGRRRTIRSFFMNLHTDALGREERLSALRQWNEVEAQRRETGAAAAAAPTTTATPISPSAAATPAPPSQAQAHSRLGAMSRLVTRRGRRTLTSQTPVQSQSLPQSQSQSQSQDQTASPAP